MQDCPLEVGGLLWASWVCDARVSLVVLVTNKVHHAVLVIVQGSHLVTRNDARASKGSQCINAG